MFEGIPQSRLILYVMVGAVLPISGAIYWTKADISSLRRVKQELTSVRDSYRLYEAEQGRNLSVYEHYRDADELYIEKNLEAITPLKPEILALDKLAKENNFVDNEAVLERLNFLKNKNKIVFAEGTVQKESFFQETTETLVQAVEMNENDLQNLLSKIEEVQLGPFSPGKNSPQLFVLELKLEKKPTDDENEVFLLNLKLIKREYQS